MKLHIMELSPRSFWRSSCRPKINMKTDAQEIGCEYVKCVKVCQNRVQWWAFVNTVMNLRFP